MHILVTGGAGFIGSNFIFHQMRKHPGDSLVCLDKLTYAGRYETLAEAVGEGKLCFIHGDIADTALVKDIFQDHRPDIVVNFAAESHVDRSIANASDFVRTNVLGVQVLLDAVKAHACRFVQISTDEVYGDLPLDADEKFTEDSPLRPSSPYSASKAAADHLVLAYCRTYRLDAVIVRCANNYGAFQYPEKLIPVIITRALRGERVPLYSRGEHIRDWIYVDDCVRAIDLVMRHGAAGEVYHIGAEQLYANADVARMILSYLGCSQDLIAYVHDRVGHDLKYALDTRKIRDDLGFRPEISFEEGLERTTRWYRRNPDFWR
ncbi:MAG: dTDP-glucose 4,6-dehydratase [Christensenellales bacterium]|jgi:dTDP-glucose 4,6-dehydratase